MSSKRNKKIRIGLYARKSKFTGKGESINNQIDSCRQYVQAHFEENGDWEIATYADEGISGKDFERPQMRRLLQDIKDDKIDVLLCYRLDRVSRSVRDFSNLIQLLTDNGKEFISVSESFDTRNPMGRAMMMIASVFSQLERETIAERISDNMYALAKTGRWLGGNTPLGFESQKAVEEDGQGKKRSRFRLVPVDEEVELVKIIFSKYKELGSLTKLETYLMNAGYRTKKYNTYYGRYVLKTMLTNPVYCIADRKALDFLQEMKYGIYADSDLFDGSHGLIAYNKNNNRGKAQRFNDVEDWVVSVGEHEGIIESEVWIEVQKRIYHNRSFSYRQPKKSSALLSGVVRCAHCGAWMRPKSSRRANDGTLRYSYVCETKERSRGGLCQMPNILGNQLDSLVVDAVLEIRGRVISEYGFLRKEFDKLEKLSSQQSESHLLKKQMEDNKRQIDTLLNTLSKSTNDMTTDTILKRLDKMNEEQKALGERISRLESGNVAELRLCPENLLAKSLISMEKESFVKLPAAKQKEILKKVIKEILWDGENAELRLLSAPMG